MNYVLAAALGAFLLLAGICTYQRHEIKIVTAERDAFKAASGLYKSAATDNSNAALELSKSLDKCNGLLFKSVNDTKHAKDQQSTAYANLDKALAAATAKAAAQTQCTAWAAQPACGAL